MISPSIGGTTAAETPWIPSGGSPAREVRFPLDRPGEGSEVRMLGNARALPHRWVDGELRIELPDHLPAAPATVFSIR